jgi:hypothetical protein
VGRARRTGNPFLLRALGFSVFCIVQFEWKAYPLPASRDDTIRLWNAETGEEIAAFIGLSGKDSEITSSARGIKDAAKPCPLIPGLTVGRKENLSVYNNGGPPLG